MAALVKNRNLTEDQKRKRYPQEWALKDLQKELAANGGVITKELENRFYIALRNLAKVVINHKYGTNSRLDYETLPHEVATSLYMTVVRKQKEVFSWTNLMKKVVHDLASNYFRKEVYNALNFVDIDQPDDSPNGSLEEMDGTKMVERMEMSSDIRAEDMVYFEQLLRVTLRNLRRVAQRITNLRDHLLLKMALYEVFYGKRHKTYVLLDSTHYARYQYMVLMLQLELAPVLNQRYMGMHL